MKPSHPLNIKLPDDVLDAGQKSPTNEKWTLPEGRYDWVKPIALQWGEWDEWKKDMGKNYPIRYFIHETIPDIWSDVWEYGIVRFFHNLKWNILHRFHPKHRYNIVKTGLEPGYYDPDTLIFEATFHLLADYVESNIKYGRIDWENDEGHAAAWKEMKELVHWYKEIYPNREKVLDKKRPEPNIGMDRLFNEKYENDPDVIEYRKYLKYYGEMEAKWEMEDEENLIRVIKLRPYLWYA